MAWSQDLRRMFPELPPKPDGFSDETWDTFVGVWNGDTLKVAAQKRGITIEKATHLIYRVKSRLPKLTTQCIHHWHDNGAADAVERREICCHCGITRAHFPHLCGPFVPQGVNDG